VRDIQIEMRRYGRSKWLSEDERQEALKEQRTGFACWWSAHSGSIRPRTLMTGYSSCARQRRRDSCARLKPIQP
jgi:hypothetical protein